MRIEQSKVKIVISKGDYAVLEAAKKVAEDMKEALYDADIDGLDFYETLNSVTDSLEELIFSFYYSAKNNEYNAEVE